MGKSECFDAELLLLLLEGAGSLSEEFGCLMLVPMGFRRLLEEEELEEEFVFCVEEGFSLRMSSIISSMVRKSRFFWFKAIRGMFGGAEFFLNLECEDALFTATLLLGNALA